MDEMREMRDFRQEVPASSRRSLLPARDRLLDEAGTTPRPLGRLLRGIRLGVPQVATAGALSVVLAGGLVAVQTVDFGGDEGNVPPSSARAAVILQKAADAARAEPAVRPDGDFTYVATMRLQVLDGRSHIEQWRRWNSVDGSEQGEWRVRRADLGQPLRPRSVPPEVKYGEWIKGDIGYQNEPSFMAPTYEYLRTLPSDPDDLAKKLREQVCEKAGPECGWAGPAASGIHEMLLEDVVPPKVHAALFEVVATMPDVAVTENAVLPLTGERGVGVRYFVSYSGEGGEEQYELVFDPETYELLGSRHLANGEFIESAAIVEKGFVDRIGQRP